MEETMNTVVEETTEEATETLAESTTTAIANALSSEVDTGDDSSISVGTTLAICGLVGTAIAGIYAGYRFVRKKLRKYATPDDKKKVVDGEIEEVDDSSKEPEKEEA